MFISLFSILRDVHAFCHSGLRAGIALELILNVTLDLIGVGMTGMPFSPYVIGYTPQDMLIP
jgi:hypothetical protein